MNKILIADDSKLILSLVASFFVGRENEIAIITANDGKEAIEKANSEKPDLILMDWQMPGMSGIDALKSLKEDSQTNNIPVVMLTASENTTEAFKLGAIDYIQKPFQKEEFLTRVNNLIDIINAKKSTVSSTTS